MRSHARGCSVDWCILREVLLAKFKEVMDLFASEPQHADVVLPTPKPPLGCDPKLAANVVEMTISAGCLSNNACYVSLLQGKALAALRALPAPPATLQRVCELLLSAAGQYTTRAPLVRAFAKVRRGAPRLRSWAQPAVLLSAAASTFPGSSLRWPKSPSTCSGSSATTGRMRYVGTRPFCRPFTSCSVNWLRRFLTVSLTRSSDYCWQAAVEAH